jgi:apolipoprotein N-acyltransferase
MGLLQKICKERGTTLVVGTQTTPKGGKQWFNTALTLNENGISGEHHKVHPVHLFNDGTPGTTRLPVKSTLGVMGTPICFDCDYQDVVRRMTAAGAEFFAVPSMDAVSWSERQHRQHAVLFQMRACENGRWFAVCASSGVSQIIDPHGMVSGSLPPLVTGELVGTLERRTGLTFFTRMGWLAPWMMLGAASVCWLAILFPHGKRR